MNAPKLSRKTLRLDLMATELPGVTSSRKRKLQSSLWRFQSSLWLLHSFVSSLDCFYENFTAPMAGWRLKLDTFLQSFFTPGRIRTFFRGCQRKNCSCLCFSVVLRHFAPPFVPAVNARVLPVLTCWFFDSTPPLDCRLRADCRRKATNLGK